MIDETQLLERAPRAVVDPIAVAEHRIAVCGVSERDDVLQHRLQPDIGRYTALGRKFDTVE